MAGYRGQAPYVTFLFFRAVTPIVMLVAAALYVFVITKLDKSLTFKIGICVGAAFLGLQAPMLFLKNAISKRQLSIKRAFPDALDLLLICIESGMSVEVAFRKVSAEIVSQSVALSEEFALTTAELSYLQDRKVAYENLAEPHRARRGEIGLPGLAAIRTLRHAARPEPARDGAGKPRHAHERGREEGGSAAAETDRADDPVLPSVPVHRHSRAELHQGHGAAMSRPAQGTGSTHIPDMNR